MDCLYSACLLLPSVSEEDVFVAGCAAKACGVEVVSETTRHVPCVSLICFLLPYTLLYAGATIRVKATGVKVIFRLERLFPDSSSEANNSSDDI